MTNGQALAGAGLGNSWRINGDVNGWWSVYVSAQVNKPLAANAGPGGWNDPDMLVGSSPQAAVHNTPAQSRTQFSLWAAMAAPLLIGSNMLGLSSYDLETYTNAEVIAVNQDPLGKQAEVVLDTCKEIQEDDIARLVDGANSDDQDAPDCKQVWAKRMSDGSVVLVLVAWNANATTTVTCDNACIRRAGIDADKVNAVDLWEHRKLGAVSEVTASLAAGGASSTIRIAAAKQGLFASWLKVLVDAW